MQVQSVPYLDLQSAKDTNDPAMLAVINFLTGFLAQPHPSLESVGRTGNVCPFTRMALETNAIRFGREAVNVSSEESKEELKKKLLEEHRERFFTEVDAVVADSRFASLLVLVDGPKSPEECDAFVSMVQKDLQPDFVNSRLLMSELHPHNRVPSLYTPNFFPSGAVPHPIFFIRKIIERDLPFLIRSDRYSPETVEKVRDALLKQFGEVALEKATK